jgi:hypothetical protein
MLFDFKKLMDGAKELLTDIDCVPIFSTIPTINILYWITIRYQQGQTGYLKYESIPQMQENLNFILLNVNKSIIMFNNSNEGKKTYLHQMSELCRHVKRTYYYNIYVDGVHPDGNLLAKWTTCLNKTMLENYDETHCRYGKRTVFFK